jgi:DNA repair photolyase
MYTFVSHMWSPIRGCQHDCPYCYVTAIAKRYGQSYPIGLDLEDLETCLGEGKIIFVGHLTDMWGSWVPKEWIDQVLEVCNRYPKNEYVFQSKNPKRFSEFKFSHPARVLLGTTIETDKYPPNFRTKAPPIDRRIEAMIKLYPLRRFVTIEPIMDFDLSNLVRIIEIVRPEFVTIGADSKGQGLSEPDPEKVAMLIDALGKSVEIRQKTNLKRLFKGETYEL